MPDNRVVSSRGFSGKTATKTEERARSAPEPVCTFERVPKSGEKGRQAAEIRGNCSTGFLDYVLP